MHWNISKDYFIITSVKLLIVPLIIIITDYEFCKKKKNEITRDMEMTVCQLIASLCPSERFDVSEGKFGNRISSFVTLLADETANCDRVCVCVCVWARARGLVIESLIAFCLNYTPAVVSPCLHFGRRTRMHTDLNRGREDPLWMKR